MNFLKERSLFTDTCLYVFYLHVLWLPRHHTTGIAGGLSALIPGNLSLWVFPAWLITSLSSQPDHSLPSSFSAAWHLPPAFPDGLSQHSSSTPFLPPTPRWGSALGIFHVICLSCLLLGRTWPLLGSLSPVYWWLSNLIQMLSRISIFI